MKRLIAIGIWLVAPCTHAIPVTYSFTGNAYGGAGAFLDEIVKGETSVSGTFSFDDGLVDLLPADATTDSFSSQLAANLGLPFSASLSLGSISVSLTQNLPVPGSLLVIKDTSLIDEVFFVADIGSSSLQLSATQIDGNNPPNALLPGFGNLDSTIAGAIALIDVLDPTRFPNPIGTWRDNNLGSVSFVWTSVSRSSGPPRVPAPQSLSLLASGLALVLATRRRRTRR